MPEAPVLPPEVHGRHVFIAAALYAGDADESREACRALSGFGTPLADISGAVPYCEAQSSFDAFFPRGELQSYWKSAYLDRIDDDAVALSVRCGTDRPHPLTLVHIPLLGGAMGRVDPADTAFGDGAPTTCSASTATGPTRPTTTPTSPGCGAPTGRRSTSTPPGARTSTSAATGTSTGATGERAWGREPRAAAAGRAGHDPGSRSRLNADARRRCGPATVTGPQHTTLDSRTVDRISSVRKGSIPTRRHRHHGPRPGAPAAPVGETFGSSMSHDAYTKERSR
jgi:hypothetical protein